LPIRRTWSASVCGASVRRRRALRRSDPRPPFRAPRAAPGTAGPIECTPFIVRHASTVRRLNGGHDRSDASLEVLVPSALACHAARVPGAATRTGDPASTVDRLHTPPPSPLMPCRHRSPTRGGVRSVLAVFRVVGVGPIDSARIDAARFDRDAPVLSRRVAASGASPAAGHAPAPFCGRRSATREAVHVAWSVPFRRREASWFSVP
jgi:hypothetical protein